MRHISQRRGRGTAAALLVGLAALVCAASAAAAPIADEAAVIYEPHGVAAIDLTLSSEAIADLEAEPSEYVKGTFAMATTSGGPGGGETTLTLAPLPVEVRLKGSGSFRPISGKAAFKFKFKKAEPFLGLRKMTLNNMVQDRSMVHEALTYLAFGAAGAPASRSGYAYLRLNGEDIGLYADVENLDKVALEKRFGTFEDPPQHLYEGEIDDDVVSGGVELFEVDEGDEVERADLDALIEAVNGSAEPFSQRVAAAADLGEMTRMWAVEHYVAHWDGYAGNAEQPGRPNNYYLFSDAAGRFQMLPWGADQTWDLNQEIPGRHDDFDTEGGLMFNLCLADEACFRLYWEALGEATDAVEAMEAGVFLDDTAAMLAPWQAREREFGRAESTAPEVTAAVNEAAAFIASRPDEARQWLAENEPPPLEEPGEEEPPIQGTSTEPPTPAVQPPLPPTLENPLRLGRLEKKARGLVVRLGVAEAGEARVRATMGLDGRQVTACSASATIEARGREAIACQLTPAARKRLAEGPLRLHLRVLFVAATGNRAVAKRQIRLTP
jgi:hypothetical protein